MSEQIRDRLKGLRQEFAAGQQMLAELGAKQTELQQTLLRISGAIQVLEEIESQENQTSADTLEPPNETAVTLSYKT